jgi:hypothetical protein
MILCGSNIVYRGFITRNLTTGALSSGDCMRICQHIAFLGHVIGEQPVQTIV